MWFEALDNWKNPFMKPKLEEQVVQKLSHRCPYCDQPVSYDPFDLKIGENKIKCPSCKEIYIKVVSEEKNEL